MFLVINFYFDKDKLLCSSLSFFEDTTAKNQFETYNLRMDKKVSVMHPIFAS